MREAVISAVKEHRLIVIVRGVAPDRLIDLGEAMYRGGVRLLEVTYSAVGAPSDEQTAESISALSKHFEGRMLIGAGTVISERQVELTARAGGKFIISPDANEAVIRKTRELGLVSMPGALTPTEITAAHRAGADFVKLFPIGNMGADYVKAVRAPLSHVSLLAVGGIDLGNIAEYRAAGVVGFGIGSSIVRKDMIERGDLEGICELAKKYVEAVR